MRAYSIDLRFRVIRAYENRQGSQRQLAQLFGVSVSFVQNLLQRYRHTGNVLPKPHKGGNRGKIVPYLEIVDTLRKRRPEASLEEMCKQLEAEVHVLVSPATMSRALQRLKSQRGKRGAPRRNRLHEQLTQITHAEASRSLASEAMFDCDSRAEVEKPLPPYFISDILSE